MVNTTTKPPGAGPREPNRFAFPSPFANAEPHRPVRLRKLKTLRLVRTGGTASAGAELRVAYVAHERTAVGLSARLRHASRTSRDGDEAA